MPCCVTTCQAKCRQETEWAMMDFDFEFEKRKKGKKSML
jgi:hypothetical protein